MKEKQIMQQKLLQDVVDQFVVNPKSRCTDKDGSCRYNPPENKKHISPGCAIGMYLTPKVAKEFDIYGSISYVPKKLLPSWMKEVGVEFLEYIQDFHDTSYFFSKKGISESGLTFIESIVKKYNLTMPSIKLKNLPNGKK